MAATHHIRQYSLQMRHRGACDGFALRRELARWQEEVWLPLLESTLERHDAADKIVRIPKLAVDIHTYGKQWRTALTAAAIRQVKEAIRKALDESPSDAVVAMSVAQLRIDILLFFLRNGRLPWWSGIRERDAWKAWLETFFSDMSLEDAVAIAQNLKDGVLRQRFLNECGDSNLWKLAAIIAGVGMALIWQEDDGMIQGFALASEVRLYYRNCLLAALSTIGDADIINRQLCRLFAGTAIKDREIFAALKNPALQKNDFHADDLLQTQEANPPDILNSNDATDEPVYVGNAGLVLLAAFLPAFFGQLALVNKDSSLSDIPKVLLVLHYLATGDADAAEWELLMPKVLCGCHPEAVVSVHGVRLSAEELGGADSLLLSVIEHWTVLKNTSTDGLRQSFLQRDGRLRFQNTHWELTVQKQAHDLLLDFLPWNAGMIKLPWMEHLLLVKWND